MESKTVSRNLFLEKLENKSTIKMKSVSQSKGGSMAFFNANMGSRVDEPQENLPFEMVPIEPLDINEILEMEPEGQFSVKGTIKWKEEERLVFVGTEHAEKRVRDAIIADNTGHIVLSVWGEDIEKMMDQ
eukprot:Seg5075.2 transcript_id=Seg5075.2/GoldUCD/mRNA.D3Y31 product="hypothetical protein" protein_id=Seg5075.2/GoldUCD/D3Y31